MTDEQEPSADELEDYGRQSAHYIWLKMQAQIVPPKWPLPEKSAFISGFEVGLHVAMQDVVVALGLAMTMDVEVHEGNTQAAEAARTLIAAVNQWRSDARSLFSPSEERGKA